MSPNKKQYCQMFVMGLHRDKKTKNWRVYVCVFAYKVGL